MIVYCATTNTGKLSEFRKAGEMADWQVEVVAGLAAIPVPDETGSTFEANAILKAEYYGALVPGYLFCDDSGLEVDALGGRPGVYSARYAGPGASDADNNALLLRELAAVPGPRTARYRCAIAFVREPTEANPLIVSASWDGRIASSLQGAGGFGYDPLFLVGAGTRPAAQFATDEKNRVSHRALALRGLIERLRGA